MCVCVCVRACVRACVRVCVCARPFSCVNLHVRASECTHGQETTRRAREQVLRAKQLEAAAQAEAEAAALLANKELLRREVRVRACDRCGTCVLCACACGRERISV